MNPLNTFKHALIALSLGIVASCGQSGKADIPQAKAPEEKKEKTEVVVPVG